MILYSTSRAGKTCMLKHVEENFEKIRQNKTRS